MKRARLALVALAILTACGKRGDPKPPVPVIPKATSDLVVTQRGPKLILSWSFPSLSTAGNNLHDVRGVTIYRYSEPLPVAGPSTLPANSVGGVDPAGMSPSLLFAKVPPPSPVQFARLGEEVDSIDGANLRGATVGSRLFYEDEPLLVTSDKRPVRVTYAVVTEGGTAKSAVSNLASIVPLDVAIAPVGLVTTPKAEGVVLTWKEPSTSITGGKPAVVGYNVYRYGEADTPDLLDTPLNHSLVTATTFTDVPPYGVWKYQVTAAASPGAGRLESDPSALSAVTFKDLLPPPVPANLTALLEAKAVRLVWDPVEAPDLSGYRIYRWEGKVRLQLTPNYIPQTNFRDISVDIGIGYVYNVTAIDKNGNESAPAITPAVLVPKTP